MLPTVLLVTLLVFFMLRLSGDPIAALLGGGEVLDEEQRELMIKEYGLDRPLIVQYGTWLSKIIRGDLGRSNRTQRPVIDEITARLPVTLELGLFSWLLSIIVAIPAGILSATRRGSVADVTVTVFTMGSLAIPGFWLGIVLILLFALKIQWFSPFGFVSVFENPIEGFKSQILPVISLGLGAAATNMRQMRSSMLEVLTQDYIRTARAKGLKERNVIWLHAFKNASLPIITIAAIQIGRLAGGAVVIETLFAVPGIGRLMVSSILASDYPTVQGCILLVAFAVLLSNLCADMLYAYADPRIRYS